MQRPHDLSESQLHLDRKNLTTTKFRPSQGDAVILSVMAGGKYSDIARNAGDSPLASDSGVEVERPNGINRRSMAMDVERIETSFEDIDQMWNRASSGNANMTSGIEDLQISDLHFGSFGSMYSMGLPTPDTATFSRHSEDFVFPIPDGTFGTVAATDLPTGLAIPGKILLIKLYYLPRDVSLVLDFRVR